MAKVPYKEVDTITSNSDSIKMRIYDGEIPSNMYWELMYKNLLIQYQNLLLSNKTLETKLLEYRIKELKNGL